MTTVVLPCPNLEANEEVSQESISSTVKSLGLKRDEDVAREFDILAQHPSEAASILVAELHPIPRKAYFPGNKSADEIHVVSCLRALRYLSSQTFQAKTAAKLSDDERQFLDFNKQMHDENSTHEIHFFGVWMSRDADYVAPEDAQLKIIRKWQNWERSLPKSFVFPKLRKAADSKDSWYWYG